ncbi:manganese ion binding protein [Aureococcus anophagefferens]|uniref:Serine/threonine-protein phosphatase n=2 Tax=Aureococcus anophagefferens TaxID=44056 RepID=A0ABR1G6J5_AURAN|nr:manganese ion binding protein [Aureococcus anophagefferens]|mmetsp:Transcript_29596/g.100603  ORF Transcript_29596/g.100603 Transcript_29596/m.100603 type:complete len:738 (-) Transcript_29596:341-2554(-)
MGAGASAQLADQVSKDEARAFAGERWNEQMDIKFDTMATKGCVAKAVIEEHMSSKELRIMDWNAIAETASKLTDVQHVEAPPVLAVEVDNSKAVVKMQGLSRKHQAGLETKKKIATQINTSMEYAKERKENKLDSFIGKLAEKMPELETKVSAKDALLDTIDKMRKSGWPMNIDKGNHKGIDLPDPITKDSIIDLMDRLNDQARKEAKKKKHCNGVKDILHAKYALQIAVNYMDMVRKLPSVVHVSTALAGKITVVGDMHGQLRDLIQVFRHNGLPSFDNPYLFNGDLVDRGDYSAEVTLLLFGFAVADPGSIYINRGNHEDMTVCTGYGFVDELVNKFSQNTNGRHLLAIVDTIFSLLPLAHVIDENVVVIHGGISDKFDLDRLRSINRRLYRTLTGLPQAITHTPHGQDKDGHTHEDWSVMMDCLWSDPAKNGERFPKGQLCKPNDERGGGIMFSKEFSKKWLDDHKLGVLVRSHECQDRGFSVTHDGRVMTLFSASNYYGDDEENDGAVLVLSPLQDPPGKLLTYSTSYSGAGGYQKMNIAQSAAKMESAALQRVEVALLDHRRELVAGLKEKDVTGSGVIKAVEWAAVMNAVVPVKLPWLHLKEKFVHCKGDSVTYTSMTDKLDAAFGGGDDAGVSSETKENLYRVRDEMSKLFRVLDTDGSGVLDRGEFVKGVELINSLNEQQIFNPQDVDIFMKQLDVNGDGKISFNEFTDGLLNHGAQAADKVDDGEAKE